MHKSRMQREGSVSAASTAPPAAGGVGASSAGSGEVPGTWLSCVRAVRAHNPVCRTRSAFGNADAAANSRRRHLGTLRGLGGWSCGWGWYKELGGCRCRFGIGEGEKALRLPRYDIPKKERCLRVTQIQLFMRTLMHHPQPLEHSPNEWGAARCYTMAPDSRFPFRECHSGGGVGQLEGESTPTVLLKQAGSFRQAESLRGASSKRGAARDGAGEKGDGGSNI
ncbi:hypothetical protein C8R43DRAFT_1155238 [Mycena crocata]|nr:hypothetical protein C8R43DRAFT_1155238 [Mycena crocata]